MNELARRLAVALCVVVTLWSRPASAEMAEVPADRAALILMRALAYDRKLKDRAGDELDLAVLVRAGDPKSKAHGEDVYAAFKALEEHTVAGLPVHFRSDGISKLVAPIVVLASAHGTHLSSTDFALASPVR